MTLERWISTLATVAILGSSGCYKATFYKDPSVIKGQEHDEWTNFYVFGLVGTQQIDVKRFCPLEQTAQIRSGGNFGTGLVSFITLGIYTPRKIYVTCSAPGQSAGASARVFAIDFDAAGTPVRAEFRGGEERVPMAIERISSTSWQLNRRQGS